MGKFKSGDPKPANSGRKKGVKNKASSLKVEETIARLGFNPTEFLVKLAQKKDTDPNLAAKIAQDLLHYTDRKLRPSEDREPPPPPKDEDKSTESFAEASDDDLLRRMNLIPGGSRNAQ